MKDQLVAYSTQLDRYIGEFLASNEGSIYDPVRYIMSLGGKRIRPSILLIAGESQGVEIKDLLPLAAAVEMFHNFTLLHDDIMDEADMRRGEQTVHLKWNRDQAILSGDIMFAMAYELVLKSNSNHLSEIMSLLTKTAKEVCIGQQMDMEFESRDEVSKEEYLEMIRLKTSVVIGASMGIGALAAGADENTVKSFYDFGQFYGMAFQIQDDILDVFGESTQVGKRHGGDILKNKKTLLYLNTRGCADADQLAEVDRLYSKSDAVQGKVETISSIMETSGALDATRMVRDQYNERALECLDRTNVQEPWRSLLESMTIQQLERSF